MSQVGPEVVAALRRAIRDVPDFPKPGILFKDITPVLAQPALLAAVVHAVAAPWRTRGVTHVVAPESRGFLLGVPVALALGAAFVPVRKPGKLPAATRRVTYDLEYGTDTIEMHSDALETGHRVLVVDDVLATGGTAAAVCQLAEAGGASVIGCGFLMELSGLRGRAALEHRTVECVLTY
ncbi:MAG: adenine phosphoribosyltransferase [Gemmatimonadaceae bacterium]|nr:adenine phosphoribosyltransferase [Gemmatimonadaceae bacterium]